MISGIQKMNWGQFTGIKTGERVYNYSFDQCVALFNLYSEGVVGAAFAPCQSAYQLWTNFSAYGLGAKYVQSSTPVTGAVFISRGGIYNATHGHVGIVTGVGNGVIYTMEQNSEVNRYVGRATRSSTAGILGYLIPRNNPATPAVSGSQRVAGPYGVKRRAAASIASKELPWPLTAGEVGNFKGFVKGQHVNDGLKSSDIWFVGISGNFFWAGGFTSQSTANLKDLTPKPSTKPFERAVAANPVNMRAEPKTSSKAITQLPSGVVKAIDGFAKSQQVNDGIKNSNIWYKIGNNWAWAGGFTSQSTAGLKEIALAPESKPEPKPEEKFVYQNPGITSLTKEDIPTWITFDTQEDSELKGYSSERWNTELYRWYRDERGQDKQYSPEEVHLHWWNDPATPGEHDAVVSYLKNAEALSVNYVLSAGRITQMIPLEFCASTTGLRNPWGWKIEIDPRLTEDTYKTIAALVFLVERKNPHLKGEKLRLHKEFMATECSGIDTKKVAQLIEDFRSGKLDINTGKEKASEGKKRHEVKFEVQKDGSLRAFVEL